ncbi:MAG: family 20 glycosylhydrolase [Myxococcota bacterium]
MDPSELLLLPRPHRLEQPGGEGAARDATPDAQLDRSLGAETFTLAIGGGRITIRFGDTNARRYARETLRQLRRQFPETLPALRIEDAPDFPVRGLMLDVSRDRVPTRETLEHLVHRMARLRLNHLELYTEHTFAYTGHEAVWRDASPLTADDVEWLDALCDQHGIELVANQNTFGHMARWLQHDAYRARAEAPDGFRTKFGMTLPPGVLAPTEDNAAFALGLCRELLACHSSRRIHIGCDETFELGQGQSAAEVEREGRGRVYLDHLLRLTRPLLADGHEVLFWGDILRHHPELVSALPKEGAIACAWHYEAPQTTVPLPDGLLELLADFGIDRDSFRGFSAHVDAFADSGLPFWVCPGTSSWNSLLGRLANARGNLLDAAETGLARGAAGYLITDWGDNGHMQPPSVSFAPVAYGASLAWSLDANRELALAEALDAFVFEDEAAVLGASVETLGNLYTATGKHALNGSPLFTDLVTGGLLGSFGEADPARLRRTVSTLDATIDALAGARPATPDGPVIVRELQQAARLARHGAHRIARAAGLPGPSDAELRRDLTDAIAEQRACWLLRSRPGGLDDSVARLEATLAGYG